MMVEGGGWKMAICRCRRLSALRAAAIVLVVALNPGSGALCGADFNKRVDIGDKAPSFSDLEGTDGKRHGLADLEDARLVVVAFTCNTCPMAKSYEQRFIDFARDYRDKDVAFVAINCNTSEADQLPAMKERAEDRGFTFPYLHDPAQDVGRDYGATVTPHLFVLDKNRRIAYMGAFDDKQDAAKAKRHYVRDAVEALLAGKEPELTETRQFGCAIEYRERSAGSN
jgi:peroxiredoxin